MFRLDISNVVCVVVSGVAISKRWLRLSLSSSFSLGLSSNLRDDLWLFVAAKRNQPSYSVVEQSERVCFLFWPVNLRCTWGAIIGTLLLLPNDNHCRATVSRPSRFSRKPYNQARVKLWGCSGKASNQAASLVERSRELRGSRESLANQPSSINTTNERRHNKFKLRPLCWAMSYE